MSLGRPIASEGVSMGEAMTTRPWTLVRLARLLAELQAEVHATHEDKRTLLARLVRIYARRLPHLASASPDMRLLDQALCPISQIWVQCMALGCATYIRKETVV